MFLEFLKVQNLELDHWALRFPACSDPKVTVNSELNWNQDISNFQSASNFQSLHFQK